MRRGALNPFRSRSYRLSWGLGRPCHLQDVDCRYDRCSGNFHFAHAVIGRSTVHANAIGTPNSPCRHARLLVFLPPAGQVSRRASPFPCSRGDDRIRVGRNLSYFSRTIGSKRMLSRHQSLWLVGCLALSLAVAAFDSSTGHAQQPYDPQYSVAPEQLPAIAD